MPRLTLAELATLDPIEYTAVVKSSLRYDELWVELLHPVLVERTRLSLTRMIESVDRQRERIGGTDPAWTKRAMVLRNAAKDRMDAMPPPSGGTSSTKEARAWRAFSAKLARELAKSDPAVLDELKVPYGGLSAAQWLYQRGENK